MAITWEWEVGAHFDTDSPLYEFGSANYLNISATLSYVKSGLRSFDYKGANNYARKAVSASRQKRVGGFFLATTPASDYVRLLSIMDASLNFLVEVRLKSNRDLALMVATAEQDTSSTAPAPSTWTHIGIDVKIDASAGWAVVYADGVEVMSFSGNTGDADAAYVQLGPHAVAVTNLYADDVYCEDTTDEAAAAPVPMRYFYEMVISGDGNYSQFTGSDGNQLLNYQLMDEQPPNEDTDYVAATAADLIDSYATTNYTVPYGLTINAVHAGTIAKKLGIAATQVKPFLRENSTDWAGTAQNANSDYTYHTERRTLCPDDSAWDQTGLDGLEVGLKSAGAYA